MRLYHMHTAQNSRLHFSGRAQAEAQQQFSAVCVQLCQPANQQNSKVVQTVSGWRTALRQACVGEHAPHAQCVGGRQLQVCDNVGWTISDKSRVCMHSVRQIKQRHRQALRQRDRTA